MPDLPDLTAYKAYERLLDKMTRNASKAEVAYCARLLAMNLAHYRIKYGELPLGNIEALIDADVLDEETVQILEKSAESMVATLALATGEAYSEYKGEGFH